MKTKLFIFSIAIWLQACSEFAAYQPPASIYDKSTVTNPYEDVVEHTPRPVKRVEKSDYSKAQNQPFIVENITPNTVPGSVPAVKPFSPAIVALMAEAEKNSRAGDLELAVSTIERALRIDSRNPTLIYKLAKLRLKQSKPRLAEDLAKKAVLLSAKDKKLKRQSWLLISEARKKQNNFYGAKEARLKAEEI